MAISVQPASRVKIAEKGLRRPANSSEQRFGRDLVSTYFSQCLKGVWSALAARAKRLGPKAFVEVLQHDFDRLLDNCCLDAVRAVHAQVVPQIEGARPSQVTTGQAQELLTAARSLKAKVNLVPAAVKAGVFATLGWGAKVGALAGLGNGKMLLSRESEFESGLRSMDGDGRQWESGSGCDIAVARSANARALSPQHAHEARRRIRAAAAPAFANALDRAVDPSLLTQFAARHHGGVDAAKLRAAFAETANRAFAAEFVRLVDGQPPASAEDIALGAIIAVAIAQTTGKYPIVPPVAVAPMAVLVHRALRPQLPQLARMAAVIAAATATPTPRPTAPAHEMAW